MSHDVWSDHYDVFTNGFLDIQGSGAWSYAGLSLLKVKESLIVIPMVQTIHTSANILHVCIHKNVPTMFQQKLHLLVHSE